MPLGFLGSLGSVPAGLGVSPQLFSCLHHYQVPSVVDLPVQQVIVLLGVVSRSPVGNPFHAKFRGKAWALPHPPETLQGMACLCVCIILGPGCVL